MKLVDTRYNMILMFLCVRQPNLTMLPSRVSVNSRCFGTT